MRNSTRLAARKARIAWAQRRHSFSRANTVSVLEGDDSPSRSLNREISRKTEIPLDRKFTTDVWLALKEFRGRAYQVEIPTDSPSFESLNSALVESIERFGVRLDDDGIMETGDGVRKKMSAVFRFDRQTREWGWTGDAPEEMIGFLNQSKGVSWKLVRIYDGRVVAHMFCDNDYIHADEERVIYDRVLRALILSISNRSRIFMGSEARLTDDCFL
ncbi:hypothetical protein FA15DRAFT_223673 [Coprinopsis marcescibilis]|uniref:Uncharacterized protein n=1 Tax=Coprinopsis marcescibilis TaxID=230819 RepID=A0A5C3KG74_COPMA|nr:hypothetical protein FA15DRAFT_223673 [Coprinopsis marcescibilis]